MFFLAATLVGWIGDFVYRKVAAFNAPCVGHKDVESQNM